jgi:hypothetical protein
MTPEQQLRSFVAKFSPADQRLIRSVRSAMRERFAGLHELVYDNYNFFVIGYSPTERPSDAVVSIAARANGVGVCFIHGAGLPDPTGLLQGAGRQTRFIRVGDAKELKARDVNALFAAALADAGLRKRPAGRGKLIIRSVSAKQRPRRRTAR